MVLRVVAIQELINVTPLQIRFQTKACDPSQGIPHLRKSLQQFLSNAATSVIPKGHIVVYVGEVHKKRFVVVISYLRNPMGGLTLPCDEETFTGLRVKACMESMKPVAEEKYEISVDIHGMRDGPQHGRLRVLNKVIIAIHPPAPFLLPHRALETCKVMSYTIPKDSQVFINVWAIGRDPRYWEDPMAFKPERFLETSLELNTSNFMFLVFGSGRRICPGLPMAAKQAPLILAGLVKCIRWSFPRYTHPTALDMEEKLGITLQKKEPLVLIPKFQNFIA